MELRSAEENVCEILKLYQVLRKSTTINPILATLPQVLNAMEEPEVDESSDIQSLQQVVDTLDRIKIMIALLEPKMSKFRKRLSELDPITGAPRYGGNTMNRVQALLKTHDSMLEAFMIVFGESDKLEELNISVSVIDDLKGTLDAQRNAQRQKSREELATTESQALKEQAEHQALLDEEVRQQLEARWLRDREMEELSRAAEASRLARQKAQLEQQRQQEESERMDRDWIAGITKGEQGIREYLALLRASTTSDDCTTALTALHTLFSQIVAHPEETKFRRVRRDHPKFKVDIGRHPGGKELLIASGFRLGKIDEVPSYISTEPNLEKEMDAWANWFNLKKQSLDCIEEEMLK